MNGLRIKASFISRAIELYETAILFFLRRVIMDNIECNDIGSLTMFNEQFALKTFDALAEWVDVSGLMIPKKEFILLLTLSLMSSVFANEKDIKKALMGIQQAVHTELLTHRGNLEIVGGLTYSYNEVTGQNPQKSSTSIFEASPGLSYFLFNNFSIGLKFNYFQKKVKTVYARAFDPEQETQRTEYSISKAFDREWVVSQHTSVLWLPHLLQTTCQQEE